MLEFVIDIDFEICDISAGGEHFIVNSKPEFNQAVS